jgi:hypothetical protein
MTAEGSCLYSTESILWDIAGWDSQNFTKIPFHRQFSNNTGTCCMECIIEGSRFLNLKFVPSCRTAHELQPQIMRVKGATFWPRWHSTNLLRTSNHLHNSQPGRKGLKLASKETFPVNHVIDNCFTFYELAMLRRFQRLLFNVKELPVIN